MVSAECILKSEWGTHLIAKKENNLFLLEKEEGSRLKGIKYEDKIYRTYDNWLEFSIDLADYFILSKQYEGALKARKPRPAVRSIN